MLSSREEQVLSYIDDDELVRWVQELVRIDSVWHPETGEGEARAAEWVAERCRAMGLVTHVEEAAPRRPNVIAYTPADRQGRRGPTLMLEGHTDVVTEGNAALWRFPPFSGHIEDGRIYGRGANDMKAGVACALAAAQAIMRSGVRLRGRLLLGMVCDEEGQMLGIKHFVARGWADGVDAAIICEPEANRICIAQKGVMWLRVTIHGAMSHGAMPLAGANSAYPLARFLVAVERLEAQEIARMGQHPTLGQPSITPTIIQSPPPGYGEAQNNVMPGAASAVLDFRLIPGQEPERLVAEIDTLLRQETAGDGRLRYTVDVLEIRHPTETDPHAPVVEALASAYRSLTGAEPVYGGVPGSTDGTILYAQRGIPIVTCGPGAIEVPHQIDEWVGIDEIQLAARLYVLAALRFLGTEDQEENLESV